MRILLHELGLEQPTAIILNYDEADRTMHQYIARLSAMIDNVYSFTGLYLGVAKINGENFKKSISDAAKIMDKKVYRTLQSIQFTTLKDDDGSAVPFNELRNRALHGSPLYGIRKLARTKNNFGYELTIESDFWNLPEKSLYSFATSFHEKILDKSVATLEAVVSHTCTNCTSFIQLD